MVTAFTPALRERLRGHLASFEPTPEPAAGRRQAAVAVVVMPGDDRRASVLLTLRARGLKRHGGQWAFPGGRRDSGETAAETALRELVEEVGLELAADDVLGRLDDYPTRSGFVIRPVVVWGREAELVPDPREVASVHRVPLDAIGAPRFRRPPFGGGPLLSLELPASIRPGRFASLYTTMYAPTAAILHQFMEVAVHGRDTRVAHFEQPRFAWR